MHINNYSTSERIKQKYKYRKKNYRGIALSSLLSKIFDNCIISLQESCLLTDDHDLQFAYKSKTSTVQCISTITEIINYYIKNSSNLYMCTLDCLMIYQSIYMMQDRDAL